MGNNYNNNYNNHNNGNYNNRNNGNNNNQRPQYKKSGFQMKASTNDDYEGMMIGYGWRKTKDGIQKIYAVPFNSKNGGSRIKEGKNGDRYCSVFVTLTTDTNQHKCYGLMNLTKKTVWVNDFGLLGTCNGGGQTKSGKFSKGFFGRIKK
jgi:hypothetical protein